VWKGGGSTKGKRREKESGALRLGRKKPEASTTRLPEEPVAHLEVGIRDPWRHMCVERTMVKLRRACTKAHNFLHFGKELTTPCTFPCSNFARLGHELLSANTACLSGGEAKLSK